MAALARSWLVLSPEGYGWDCYRHYEACLAGSVPVINFPSYRRAMSLRDRVHCFYYDPRQGSLAELLRAWLADKQKLEAGQRHVLANHTKSAVVRYIVREIVRENDLTMNIRTTLGPFYGQ